MQSRPVGIYQCLILKHLILTNTIEGITEVKLPECLHVYWEDSEVLPDCMNSSAPPLVLN